MQLNEHTKLILGMPNFKCAPIAHRLVKLGHEIPPRSEDEQAYVINWMLELYEQYGKGWSEHAERVLAGEVES
ncbi:hypothetical protein [Marinobacterium lutimaris]|uniref:Uncharacterized protein n=1 Tax=Marinobacterium lutimaris TaxID=568106 RepID=A0A1H5YD25_9GAMM|nr:hypothetical protein [Marinobacterium lutimaris]SEG21874.1 hypothetical protein SAMN05444390_1011709 [Marinobacterium lutimaris]